MTRVLTVDDSRAIRSMLTKQIAELGFEVGEAEHGEDGLAKLQASSYDLVLLDVTMPVLDGPGMLAKMRERGDKTPVLMLTSESKRSIVSSVMKSGIEDYVLKPFKPEELRAKVLKALKLDPSAVRAPGAAPPPAGSPGASEPPAAAPGKGTGDLLVIDDMEPVHKKLKAMLPAHLSMSGAVNAQSALAACREKAFRVILLDTEMPDVSSVALLAQLRALQPHSTLLALTLRTSNDAEAEAKNHGYDGVMFKPFTPDSIEDFLGRHFENQDLLSTENDLARAVGYTGKEERLERYFKRLEELMEPFLNRAAAACYDGVVFDVSQVPARPDRTPRMLLNVQKQAKKLGLAVRLVGAPEMASVLRGIAETASMPFFASLDEARAAA